MIIRNKNRETFTVISNQAINDSQISDKALGTLVRLLSKPDNWNLNVNHMVKTGKQGRTAVRSSIAELEKAGYINKEVIRNQAGRITGTEFFVYEKAEAGKQGVSTTVSKKDGNQEQKIKRGSPHTTPLEVSPNLGKSIMQDEVPEQHPISQVGTAIGDELRCQGNRPTENVPVINTNIEQRLRVTTTTTPDLDPVVEVEEPVEVVEKQSSQSYPATEDINSLLDLIPEQHRQPMVISLVNQSVKEYTALELEEAIFYASANVRGGWMQYKAYLDKTLKGKWAAGYLEQTTVLSKESIFANHGIVNASARSGGFSGTIPAGRFPNGTVTGCARMDKLYGCCTVHG